MADHPAAGLTSTYVLRQRVGTIMQPIWGWRVVSTYVPPAVIAGTRNQDSLPTVAHQIPHDVGLVEIPWGNFFSQVDSNQHTSRSMEPRLDALNPVVTVRDFETIYPNYFKVNSLSFVVVGTALSYSHLLCSSDSLSFNFYCSTVFIWE